MAALADPLVAGSFTYSYDALGRLTQANLAGTADIAYRYDPAGNRSAVTVAAPTTATSPLAAPSATAEPAVAAVPDAPGSTAADSPWGLSPDGRD